PSVVSSALNEDEFVTAAKRCITVFNASEVLRYLQLTDAPDLIYEAEEHLKRLQHHAGMNRRLSQFANEHLANAFCVQHFSAPLSNWGHYFNGHEPCPAPEL